jgi:hypothetical protein
MKEDFLSDSRRKGARCGGNRLLVYHSARLDCLLDDSTRVFLNVLIDTDERTIAQSWLSFRRPDAHSTAVSDFRQQLRRLFSEDRPPSPGSGAALPQGLRASSRRSHRPNGQTQQSG